MTSSSEVFFRQKKISRKRRVSIKWWHVQELRLETIIGSVKHEWKQSLMIMNELVTPFPCAVLLPNKMESKSSNDEWHTDTQTSRTQFSQNTIRKQYMKLPKHLQIHIKIFEHVQIQMNVYIVRKFEQGHCFTELYVLL